MTLSSHSLRVFSDGPFLFTFVLLGVWDCADANVLLMAVDSSVNGTSFAARPCSKKQWVSFLKHLRIVEKVKAV